MYVTVAAYFAGGSLITLIEKHNEIDVSHNLILLCK